MFALLYNRIKALVGYGAQGAVDGSAGVAATVAAPVAAPTAPVPHVVPANGSPPRGARGGTAITAPAGRAATTMVLDWAVCLVWIISTFQGWGIVTVVFGAMQVARMGNSGLTERVRSAGRDVLLAAQLLNLGYRQAWGVRRMKRSQGHAPTEAEKEAILWQRVRRAFRRGRVPRSLLARHGNPPPNNVAVFGFPMTIYTLEREGASDVIWYEYDGHRTDIAWIPEVYFAAKALLVHHGCDDVRARYFSAGVVTHVIAIMEGFDSSAGLPVSPSDVGFVDVTTLPSLT